MFYGKKIVLKNAQKIEIFAFWIFGTGDQNFCLVFQKLASFCLVATLTLELSHAENGPNKPT